MTTQQSEILRILRDLIEEHRDFSDATFDDRGYKYGTLTFVFCGQRYTLDGGDLVRLEDDQDDDLDKDDEEYHARY